MQINNKKPKPLKNKAFSGKSFYIALALSLVAIGSAAWFGVNSAIDNLKSTGEEPKTSQISSKEDEWEEPSNVQTQAPQSNVKEESSNVNTSAKAEEGYILPVSGKVLNNYSGETMVKSKTLNDWVLHTGVDIKAAVNTPVKAIAGGKITSVEKDDMWGTTVTIEHSNSIVSVYCGLKAPSTVKKGTVVKMGDVIGTVGNTAEIEESEESHLHFGVKKKGEWIDPLSICK